jgi:hypothetical protein
VIDIASGIEQITADDPASAAAQLAAERGAELATDAGAAEAAVAARTSAAVLLDAHGGWQPREPRVPLDAVGRLRDLASQLGRALRVREKTEAGVTATVVGKLSSGTGVAVHPAAIRAAAQAVVRTDHAVASAESALAALGERPGAGTAGGVEVPPRLPDMLDEDALDAAQTRTWAISLGIAVVGLTLIVVGLGFVPVWVAPIGVLVAAAVALVILRRGKAARMDSAARRETADTLKVATATADRAGEAAAQSREVSDVWYQQRTRLDIAYERATGEQRAAHRAWEALAGADADPYDIDGVLRLSDPQFDVVGADLDASPTIRTVSALHRKALARWRVAWAAVGVDEPPHPDEAADDLARLEAEVLLSTPLVLVEPGAEIEDELATLPAGVPVTVVVRGAAAVS